MNLHRRELLVGAASLWASSAFGFGSTGKVRIAELDLGAGIRSRPDAWERLLHEVHQTTSIECDPTIVSLKPSSEDIFAYPLAVLVGDSAFAMPDERGLEQLSRYLSYGGFLWVDDVSGAENSGFDRSVRDLCRQLFPTKPLSPIPSDHSVFRSFFLLSKPVGRVDRFSYLEGIMASGLDGQGGYSPLLYGRNDLSGALDRGPDGNHRYACIPNGERQRREAVKLGINLIMYCLTSDYKRDQAHVKALMESGRLGEEWDSP